MDRTNRKFGETNINVLTPAITCRGVAFPILIAMLDKRGNSHTQEQISENQTNGRKSVSE
ncbi:MAG: hypothetical protein LBT83_01720 [Tannerella sp.]|nr:hypothetical protein [Tannerella sp.]